MMPQRAWLARVAFYPLCLRTTLRSILFMMIYVADAVKYRRAWLNLCYKMMKFEYWNGIAREVETPRALNAWFSNDITTNMAVRSPAHPLELELSEGLEAAESMLNRIRPMELRLRLRGQFVCALSADLRCELLHGGHLRPKLATEYAHPMLVALAVSQCRESVGSESTPQKLVSYLGLNPSVWQSATAPVDHGAIKQGRAHAGGMLVGATRAFARALAPLRDLFQGERARRVSTSATSGSLDSSTSES
jgi:hypothetical protein